MTSSMTRDPGGPGAGRFGWWAGMTGLAASVAFVITAVTNGSVEDPESSGDMTQFLVDVSDNEAALFVYGLAGVALCLLYIPMSVGVTSLLGGSAHARLGTIAVVAGLGTLLPAYLMAVAGPIGLSRAAEGAETVDLVSFYAVYEFVSLAAELLFQVGSLLSLGIGIVLWGVAARSSGRLPSWLGALLVGAGVLGFVWVIPPSDNPVQLIVVLVNVIASLVAFVAISWRLRAPVSSSG